MKWFIFVIVAVAILVVFAVVYGITHLINQRKRPKYKTSAPDDDPKFLRDLAEKLKAEPEPSKEQAPEDKSKGPQGDDPDETPEENRPSDK